ncbi:hypothetical protein TOT_010000734 [Theileria orientalis strain Shintoku]|uniref:Uncharacterized protein n=1 Tax=Theileria orientalis strain Shintoku TaxID=869250 RepID=J4D605_THEOR|nr:hypothetical protein TOT_010000734 [Theileria orientalis strain Shintoku]PVC51974.1 hypothetical protein MACL_00001130 [Theileria orientalis]BAM39275.1 hypothetical protein TOT_010000734 [Theileria orientalis strain Shintoku]|eukprot:XP_009689576.1 hypothetical protein TOT_010000734 [Theileria orientalis strain Shintoku]
MILGVFIVNVIVDKRPSSAHEILKYSSIISVISKTITVLLLNFHSSLEYYLVFCAIESFIAGTNLVLISLLSKRCIEIYDIVKTISKLSILLGKLVLQDIKLPFNYIKKCEFLSFIIVFTNTVILLRIAEEQNTTGSASNSGNSRSDEQEKKDKINLFTCGIVLLVATILNTMMLNPLKINIIFKNISDKEHDIGRIVTNMIGLSHLVIFHVIERREDIVVDWRGIMNSVLSMAVVSYGVLSIVAKIAPEYIRLKVVMAIVIMAATKTCILEVGRYINGYIEKNNVPRKYKVWYLLFGLFGTLSTNIGSFVNGKFVFLNYKH